MGVNIIVCQRFASHYAVYQYYLGGVGEAVLVAIDNNNVRREDGHFERLCEVNQWVTWQHRTQKRLRSEIEKNAELLRARARANAELRTA